MTEPSHPPSPLGDVDVRDVWSPEIRETFRIFLGQCGSKPVAALIVTDGNGLFGMALDTVRLMQIPALLPDMVVVAIGYADARTIADTIEKRYRDLTPTPSSGIPMSGGGPLFRRFIDEHVVQPLRRQHGDGLRTIYFGHSLGGALGASDAVSEQPTFDHHILSSPSLWWDDYWIFDEEARLAARANDLRGDVFIGIGADETDDGRRREAANLPRGHHFKPPPDRHLDMLDDARRFVRTLSGRGYPNLIVASVVLDGEYHATAPVAVLTRGLRHILEKT